MLDEVFEAELPSEDQRSRPIATAYVGLDKIDCFSAKKIVNDEGQELAFEEFADCFGFGERTTVKEVERWIGQTTYLLSRASWDLTDGAVGNPKAGACVDCDKRSSCRPGLFDDYDADQVKVKKDDRCLDQKCWKEKSQHGLKVLITELRIAPSPVELRGQSSWRMSV